MSNQDALSSEQALDDYFFALLDEEVEDNEAEAELQLSAQTLSSPELEPELELQRQPDQTESRSFRETYSPELEAPNLADVERLLSQLESTNVTDELGIDEIFAKNTSDIAQQASTADVEATHSAEELNEDASAEVQEWTIEAPVAEVASSDTTELQPEIEQVIEAESQGRRELDTQTGSDLPSSWQSTQRTDDFQVLYFDVNDVLFAVPLDELGGIHRISELNHLIGKPAWYLGLQTNREQQFDVVDTAKWVMADKLGDEQYKDNYQYVVMLGESAWGLASNQLMGTETLRVDKIRWREQSGKRPWLAGMVKEKMCALIHVQALIDMLNAGLDVNSIN